MNELSGNSAIESNRVRERLELSTSKISSRAIDST